jgi:NAD dependent epimerase/dehydratase family enzyme
MYVVALTHGEDVNTINAVSNNRVRNREFSEALADALSRPHFLKIPQFALRMLFGDFAEEMLYSQRVTSRAEEKLGITLQFDQLRKALHDLLDKPNHN